MTSKYPKSIIIQNKIQEQLLIKLLHRVLFPEDGTVEISVLDQISLHPLYQRLTGSKRKIRSNIVLMNAGDD